MGFKKKNKRFLLQMIFLQHVHHLEKKKKLFIIIIIKKRINLFFFLKKKKNSSYTNMEKDNENQTTNQPNRNKKYSKTQTQLLSDMIVPCHCMPMYKPP
jgi:hypothetical protein